MSSWTHLVRFVAVEDDQEHLGQLVDTSRDVGRDSVDGKDIAVYLVDGTIFDARVTKEILHVKKVRDWILRIYLRCSNIPRLPQGVCLPSHILIGHIALIPSHQGRLQLYPLPRFELHGPR